MIKALNLNFATANSSYSSQKSNSAPTVHSTETAGTIASSAPCSTSSSGTFSAMA